MYSDGDTPKGWVAPFGHPGIKACSRLPRDFRSVPRPSSPPGAKASTRCPSHAPNHSQPELSPRPPCKIRTNPIRRTRHAQEPSTPLSRHPEPTTEGSIQDHARRNALPIPQQATLRKRKRVPVTSLNTHSQTPLDPAATPALRPTATPSQGRQQAPGQTPMPAQPRTPQHSPEPSRSCRHTVMQTHRPEPPEASCASRDAPEPDSQSIKNNTPPPHPIRDKAATGRATCPRALQGLW